LATSESTGGTGDASGYDPTNVGVTGGTIDGTVIGGSDPAAGTFTTFTSLGIDDNATSKALEVDATNNLIVGTLDFASYGARLDVTTNTNFTNAASASGHSKGVLFLATDTGLTAGNGVYGAALSFGGINTGRRRAAISVYQDGSSSSNCGLVFFVHNGPTPTDQVDESFRINSTGNIVMAAGKGINFGSTGGAVTGKTLDDYEEGTWTAVLSDGTNNATSTSSNGYYVKIGRMVHIKGHLTISNLGSVSGDLRISGLPFTSSASFGSHVGGFGKTELMSMGSAADSIICDLSASSTNMKLRVWDSTVGNTPMQHTEWSSDGKGNFAATYYV